MSNITFYNGEQFPLEMHKVRIVQKLNLPKVEDRLTAMEEAGFNTFLLKNENVFMDMLTDSGVNAMSDRQQAAMMQADDSYAGSATFTRLENKLEEIFGTKYFLPTHQGRASENIISQVLVKPNTIVPMNYHFTTSKAHITLNGGRVEEVFTDEALNLYSDAPFKGNMDIDKLNALIEKEGAEKIAYVRMEAGTNLIGGQPFSLANLKEVRQVCDANDLLLVLDASLLADNLHFIKTREAAYKEASIRDITREITDLADITYFSARKLGNARGGAICTNNEEMYMAMREYITLYEGFLTYGGMSVREMEAIAVGLEETMDEEMINQGPEFIAFMTEELQKRGVPVITPAGGLGCHIDARAFVPHIEQADYPAGALAAAIYIASGARGMERGTMSEQRNEDGSELLANMELVRMAMPRRVFTLSQVKYVVDRIAWLYDNRELIEGIEFVEEPNVLRFFFGRLQAKSDWPERLAAKFREDFGDSL
ncbi:MAG TPA: tryptophanase [Savagea sp.]